MANPELPRARQISAGVIVLSWRETEPMILLLEQNNKRYNRKGKNAKRKVIDIGPSGKVESGETLIEAAKRELKQETNLDLIIARNFRESYSYSYDVVSNAGKYEGRKIHILKTRIYFLAKASEKDLAKLKLSDEHVKYYLMPLEQAIKSKLLMKPQALLLKRLKERLS